MITIDSVTITPMQRAVVSFTSDHVSETYTVTASHVLYGTHSVTVDGEASVARIPDILRRNAGYTITVESDTETSDPEVHTVTIETGMPEQVRQAVFDALLDGEPDGVATYLSTDEMLPYDVSANEQLSCDFPAVEVGIPMLTARDDNSNSTCIETWLIPVRLWSDGDPDKPETLEYLWPIWRNVQNVIDATGNLGLPYIGKGSHTWSVESEFITERENISGISATLSIPITRYRGQS